jgi:hypothetical protein
VDGDPFGQSGRTQIKVFPNSTTASSRIPPQAGQRGSPSPAAIRSRVDRLGIRSPHPGADHLVDGTVQLKHLARAGAGPLVQPVDILGEDPHGDPAALRTGQRPVLGIRPGLPRGVPEIGTPEGRPNVESAMKDAYVNALTSAGSRVQTPSGPR